MVTVLLAAGMRFVIHTDDHEPAHVHDGGEARIDILRLVPISNRRKSRRDLSRAIALVAENRDMLLNKLRQIHG